MPPTDLESTRAGSWPRTRRGGAALWLQVDPLAPGEEFPNLIQGLQAVRVESHDHPPMIRDQVPVQAHLSLEETYRGIECGPVTE